MARRARLGASGDKHHQEVFKYAGKAVHAARESMWWAKRRKCAGAIVALRHAAVSLGEMEAARKHASFSSDVRKEDAAAGAATKAVQKAEVHTLRSCGVGRGR